MQPLVSFDRRLRPFILLFIYFKTQNILCLYHKKSLYSVFQRFKIDNFHQRVKDYV